MNSMVRRVVFALAPIAAFWGANASAGELGDAGARALMDYAECLSTVSFAMIDLPETRPADVELAAQVSMELAQKYYCHEETVSALNAVMALTGSARESDNQAILTVFILSLQGSLKAYARKQNDG